MAFYQCVKVGGGGTGDVADVEVNGTSVVDPISKVAEITSYEEVTLSEYEAIPVAERESNGIAYFIKDLNNESVQGYPPLIYSDEEREIGVWRDGKPLYQKTVHIGSLTFDTNWHRVAHGIANIDKVISCEGIMFGTDGSDKEFYPLPNYRSNTNQGIVWGIQGASSEYVAYINNWYNSTTDAYATLCYTKTTDTAGSGIWNGQGGIAHHYSTNEQVIGTWIDGKPLYEKTFTPTSPSIKETTSVVQDITSLNINIPVSINGNINNIPINWNMQDGQNYCICFVNLAKTGIVMKVGNNTLVNTSFNVTIQYTKTTD